MLACSPGGGYFVGHDSVCATVSNLASGVDGIPRVVADWNPHVEVWPRATRGAEADVGFYRIPGNRDTYVDAMCSLANLETYPGCERKAGNVAEKKHEIRTEIIQCLILRRTIECMLLTYMLCHLNGTDFGPKKQ